MTHYPAECYLPIQTPRYGGERVIDFSNPLTIKLERERAFAGVVGHEKETGRMEMDFADYWDKWPGQYDPFMSALETYHAGGAPWRDVIDQKAPRMVVRSNMNVVDHSYGLVDICRISEDADGGYEQGLGWDHWFTIESVVGGDHPGVLQRPRVLERPRWFPCLQVQSGPWDDRDIRLRTGEGQREFPRHGGKHHFCIGGL